jgi:hypothetical protein
MTLGTLLELRRVRRYRTKLLRKSTIVAAPWAASAIARKARGRLR